MKTLLTAFLSLTITIVFAQTQVNWVGGTPGSESSWNEARNWSNNRVPDENSFVIIKFHNSGHHAQPIIDGDVKVASIEIYSGANLMINETGVLTIDGEYTYTQGISIYGGELLNEGAIHFYSVDSESSNKYLSEIENTGSIVVYNEKY